MRDVYHCAAGSRIVGRQTFGFRKPELLAHDIRAEHNGDHLVGRMPRAHAFAAHPTIGRDDQPFGRDILQYLADQGRDFMRALDLQRVMIDHADDDLLVLDHFADCVQVAGTGRAGLERQRIGPSPSC